jgi:hypothetical protein
MKIFPAIVVVLLRCAAGFLFCQATLPAAELTVIEEKGANGVSVIQVRAADGTRLTAYKIDLGTHHHPATSADDKLVKKFKSWKYGAFLCFNSNQYSGSEFCTSKDPVNDFQPTALDVKQWISTLKGGGMNYAVLTVRHTSEFLLWDSKTSNIKVTKSVYGKDIVKEYVEECRKQGIEPGIYYCLWGAGWRPNSNARAIILAQLHELATNYGLIPYFWLDMPPHTGWLAKDLSLQEIYDSLKNVHADTIVMFNNGIQDGSVVNAFPTDVINGEMCSPPAAGHNPKRTIGEKTYYIPFEYEPCSQQRGTHVVGKWDFPGAAWFTYGSGKSFEISKPLSPEFLCSKIHEAYKRRADAVLLACAPDHTGLFRKEDVEQLDSLGKMLSKTP